MSYRALRRRVRAAELALHQRVDETQADWQRLSEHTRRAATPLRIVGAGFVSGLLIGFTAPLARVGASPRLLQFVTQLASLIGALQVQQAAEEATDAAADAGAAAENAGAVAATARVTTPSPHDATVPPLDPDALLDAIRRTGT